MILEAGFGQKAAILNTDKVLTVLPRNSETAWVSFSNGTREELPVSFANFEDIPGFHRVIELSGTDRETEIMVNLGQFKSAHGTKAPDEIYLYLDRAVDYDGGYSNGSTGLRLKMGLSDLSDLLRQEDAPAPGCK